MTFEKPQAIFLDTDQATFRPGGHFRVGLLAWGSVFRVEGLGWMGSWSRVWGSWVQGFPWLFNSAVSQGSCRLGILRYVPLQFPSLDINFHAQDLSIHKVINLSWLSEKELRRRLLVTFRARKDQTLNPTPLNPKP